MSPENIKRREFHMRNLQAGICRSKVNNSFICVKSDLYHSFVKWQPKFLCYWKKSKNISVIKGRYLRRYSYDLQTSSVKVMKRLESALQDTKSASRNNKMNRVSMQRGRDNEGV